MRNIYLISGSSLGLFNHILAVMAILTAFTLLMTSLATTAFAQQTDLSTEEFAGCIDLPPVPGYFVWREDRRTGNMRIHYDYSYSEFGGSPLERCRTAMQQNDEGTSGGGPEICAFMSTLEPEPERPVDDQGNDICEPMILGACNIVHTCCPCPR